MNNKKPRYNKESRSNNESRSNREPRFSKEPRFNKERNFDKSEDDTKIETRIEGKNPVLEAIRANRTIDKLWIQKEILYKDPILKEIHKAVKDAHGVIYEVDKQALNRLANTEAHQGVIAQVAAKEYVSVEDILQIAKDKNQKPLLIILDGIQDSYNFGSIFRIAEAAGVHGIIIPDRRQVLLNAVVEKASVGAASHVPCAKVKNLTQTIEYLKSQNIWVLGTDLNGDSLFNNTALDNPDAIAVVIGNEGDGIRPLVKQHCDFLVKIPMYGKINSLNAAVATGIVIYEINRRRESNEGLNF